MHSPLIGWSRNLYLAGIVLALVLVVPTVWFPFQLTKVAVFALFAAAALVLFVMGGGMRELTRSHGFALALLIGALPAAYLVSALLAVDPSVAYLGYGLESGTVVFIVLAALAFVLAFALFRTQRTARTLLTVLAGALGAAVVFQLVSVVFGTNVIPFETFADRSVNLIGKWNDLGLLVGLLFMLLLARVELAPASPLARAGVAGVGLVLAVLLGIINFTLVWALLLVFALGLGVVAFLSGRAQEAGELGRLPVFSAVVAVVAALFLFFGQSFNVGLTSVFPVSSLEVRPSYASTMDINAASRGGAVSRLFFGAGPNSFGQQWLLHKPAEVNQSAFWNVDFNVGFSALSTAFGMVGIVGLLAWLIPLVLVGMAALRVMRRSILGKDDKPIAGALIVGSLFLFAALAFYAPSQNLILLAFVLWGAAFGYLWRQGREAAAEPQASSRLTLIGTGVFALALIVLAVSTAGLSTRRFVSEIFVNRGIVALQSPDAAMAFTYAARAAGVETTGNALRLAASAGAATMGQIAQNTELPEEQARASFEAALGQTVLASQQAALLNPGDYRPHLILGNVYDFLAQLGVEGAYAAAVQAYADAGSRNPTNPGLPLAVARLEGAQGNLEAARAKAGESLTLKPNYTDAILFVVQLDVAQNDLPAAITAASAAAQTAPGVAPIWFQLGLLHYAAGDSESAIGALERAVALVPNYANARYFLGLSYYAQNRNEDAIRQFEGLAAENPDNAELSLILGNLRFGNPPFEGAQPPVTPEPETRPEAPIED
jgi:tetratricopeptide (TPR) repeat protein